MCRQPVPEDTHQLSSSVWKDTEQPLCWALSYLQRRGMFIWKRSIYGCRHFPPRGNQGSTLILRSRSCAQEPAGGAALLWSRNKHLQPSACVTMDIDFGSQIDQRDQALSQFAPGNGPSIWLVLPPFCTLKLHISASAHPCIYNCLGSSPSRLEEVLRETVPIAWILMNGFIDLDLRESWRQMLNPAHICHCTEVTKCLPRLDSYVGIMVPVAASAMCLCMWEVGGGCLLDAIFGFNYCLPDPV